MERDKLMHKNITLKKWVLYCFAVLFWLTNTIVQAQSTAQSTTSNDSRSSLTQKALSLLRDYKDIKMNLQELLSAGAQLNSLNQASSLSGGSNVPTAIATGLTDISGVSSEPLVLKMRNVEIKDVLQNLAEELGLALSISPDIRGKISVDFDHVTPEEALQRIAAQHRLEIQKTGRVLSVKRRAASSPDPSSLEFSSIVISLRNISPEDAAVAANGLISQYGSVAINNKARTLLIHDTVDRINEIKKVMPLFDPEPKQISVEGAILEVNRSNKTTIGFNWFGTDSTMNGSKKVWGNLDARGFAMPPNDAAAAMYATVLYGSIGTMLEAVKSNSNVEVLSSPRILVTEGHEAKIIVGKKLGYRTTSTSASQMTMENIQFLEVGTQLTVTPYIIDDKTIVMDIHPEVSDGAVDATGLPNVNTSEATTRVMIEEGQTLVIGGLINKKINKVVKKVPLLGSIPLLGTLFRRTVDEITRSEMIVLISPHFVNKRPDAAMKLDIDRVERSKAKKIF